MTVLHSKQHRALLKNKNNMNISEFKKGDIITRTEPIVAESSGSGWLIGTASRDYSHVGKEIEYIGSANGVIYTNVMSELKQDQLKQDQGKTPVSFYSSRDSEGWEMWIDPKTLND